MDRFKRWKAMGEVCRKLFGRNNLIASDFANMEIVEIARTEAGNTPGGPGKRISFEIGNDALGKVMDAEMVSNLDLLVRQADEPAQPTDD